MNLSGISNQKLFGKIVRLPLRLIPAQARIRIVQGPVAWEEVDRGL